MRAPRRSERIPVGGKQLYELLRLDHEPILLSIFLVEEVEEPRLDGPDTLGYSREFDPMQYFWPVEGQHCVAELRQSSEHDRKRLMKALQRDKAAWISVIWYDGTERKFEHWGDADGFMRSRYGGTRASGALGTMDAPA